MKKLLCVALMIVMLLPLLGCDSGSQEKPAYQYIDGNDGFDYVILNMEIPDYDRQVSRPDWYVQFQWIDEMIWDLKTGNLTQDELGELSRMTADEEGRILIPDLDALYEPVYPGSATLEKFFMQREGTYYFMYDKFGMQIITEESFRSAVEVGNHFEGAPFVTLEDVEEKRTQKSDTNYRTISYYYIYQTEERTLYIEEEYGLPVTEQTSPKQVRILAEYDAGLYVRITVSELPEGTPVLEWLASFGVKPYEGGSE